MSISHNEFFKPKASRVEAFSDGVFAIIITLLVLEIKIPHLQDTLSNQQAFNALLALFPKIISFVLSFIYIAAFWVNHHQFFQLLSSMNRGLMWQNIALLLCLSFVPFPTASMGEYPHNAVALAFFALILTLSGVCFNIMWWYAARHGLFNESVTKDYIEKGMRLGLIGPILYALAAGVAFLIPLAAWFIFIMIPVYYFSPRDWRGGFRNK